MWDTYPTIYFYNNNHSYTRKPIHRYILQGTKTFFLTMPFWLPFNLVQLNYFSTFLNRLVLSMSSNCSSYESEHHCGQTAYTFSIHFAVMLPYPVIVINMMMTQIGDAIFSRDQLNRLWIRGTSIGMNASATVFLYTVLHMTFFPLIAIVVWLLNSLLYMSYLTNM